MNRRKMHANVYYRNDFSQSTKLKIAEHMINSKKTVYKNVYYRMLYCVYLYRLVQLVCCTKKLVFKISYNVMKQVSYASVIHKSFCLNRNFVYILKYIRENFTVLYQMKLLSVFNTEMFNIGNFVQYFLKLIIMIYCSFDS